jgi:protein-S-isoprenylcysteine O-methyltransferase Ste14
VTDNTRDNPGVVTIPPLVPLAALLIGLALDWLLPLHILSVLNFWPRLILALVLTGAGIALELFAGHIFDKAGTNIPPWKPALHLATGGIYRVMRNPMYVGFFAILASLAVAFASDWTFVTAIPAALILHFGVVLREERYLESKFGDEYRRYKAAVPRYGWPF